MSEIKKILLIQLMSNGDCLYVTAIAKQIKNDYPNCHLTWAIGSFCKSIIANNPFVDSVLEIPDVSKNTCDKIARQLRKDVKSGKYGLFDKVFFTQILDENQANYDGCIRSALYRGYGKPITVSKTPVLRLYESEILNVKEFAEKHSLSDYKNIILFEFAPQSGQLAITKDQAISLSNRIVENPDTAIILSSNIKINENNRQIIDGSTLSLRETAALTHYCTLLLGCSSGITWVSTSDAAKQLPMVEILDPSAFWVNPISRDFERCGFSTDSLIELYENDSDLILKCIETIFENGFSTAKAKYSKPLPLQFKTTSRTIYNLLCYLQFDAIYKHIKINLSIFGWNPKLIREIIIGFVTAPFKLVKNVTAKKFG